MAKRNKDKRTNNLSHELTDCWKYQTKGKKYYTENEVISELEFLIDNIFIELE
jgi:hypothetical protein